MKKTYSPEFKSKLVLEILRGEQLLNEIVSEHNVHPNMLTRWKTDDTKKFHILFENENAKIRKQSKGYESQIDDFYSNDRVHDMFIYGVDINKALFYIADCFANGKYAYKTCSFHELICGRGTTLRNVIVRMLEFMISI